MQVFLIVGYLISILTSQKEYGWTGVYFEQDSLSMPYFFALESAALDSVTNKHIKTFGVFGGDVYLLPRKMKEDAFFRGGFSPPRNDSIFFIVSPGVHGYHSFHIIGKVNYSYEKIDTAIWEKRVVIGIGKNISGSRMFENSTKGLVVLTKMFKTTKER